MVRDRAETRIGVKVMVMSEVRIKVKVRVRIEVRVNVRIRVEALYHAGIGDETIEKIFAVLNIPCISHSNLKVQERKVDHAIEKIAQDSCNTALEREVQESSEGLCVSFDAGWQKRGSGRNYNSLSGHSSMYGCQTNKLIGYDVMCKSCMICDEPAKKGDNYPREHDCRKNWGGSAKGMEHAMAVNIIKNIHDKGHTVKQLAMDDDATTISKVHNEIDIDIEKLSDKNHNLKNFTNSLYCLQKEHKLQKTNEELVLSPGKHTKQYVEKKERKRAREESMRQTREFKRRRRELKSTETRKTRASEIREGVTYQTNVDNDGYAKSATEEIPPPPVTPHEVPLQRKEYTRIYFDLETTGLGLHVSDITQISAVYKTTEFSMYVIPESPIQASASRVTGLTYDGTTMFKNGIPVPCHPLQHALEEFNTWLQQFDNPLLFAHNAKKFDSRVLCYAINKVNDAKLVDSICGFCDTLLLCKDVLPGHDSYSQENLVKNVLHLEYYAHTKAN
ncbi:hypothetical protein FSP39_007048 [Pinctada imbricata]|uniref:Exonuclease domain-containing protein n=1 Tax=Pinctada imbricata TaxID=66713 RepID=A0AA89BWZ3_PINIB|nr:hypothetical protein FSP39_007048 [Pinctada imbricata]